MFSIDLAEKPRDAKGEREARIESPGLDCDHCLPGYLQSLGEPGLRPAALSAEQTEAIAHGLV